MTLTAVVASAQEHAVDTLASGPVKAKIVTNAQMIGVGGTNILDTYISPEKYSGTEIRYISHTVRERPSAGLFSTVLIHQGYLSFSDNRANEGGAIAGMYCFSYGKHLGWTLMADRLRLRAGAQIDANVGFLYNTRNGNNPAQARVSLNLSPSAAAAYRFAAGRQMMTVGYELSIPVVGVLFSPNYGQSYYEIFNEGNYDHNIVPVTVGCAPSLRQMLTLDIHLRRASLRIGYYGDIEQYEVNNLKYHNYSHIFMIGFVKRFEAIRLRP